VKIGKLTKKEIMNSLNEVRILASITHKNVIAYKEAFYDEESLSLCIIMEYANDKDLYQ
jgi:NIMA (never in mitosis gene a)-related kinase 1/4/5